MTRFQVYLLNFCIHVFGILEISEYLKCNKNVLLGTIKLVCLYVCLGGKESFASLLLC